MAYTTIDKPEGYFNTVLWTGNNSSPRDITTGHATDFVWVKFRANPYNHRLFDNVRGGGKKLISNNTDAEDTGATGDVSGFISTGFTIGSNINNSADGTLVGWSWKANGTGVSNTSGTISSTVSANTTSGFSIVSYTGNGTNGATVGHGLGTTPSMMIVKRRDAGSQNWDIYHKSIGATKGIRFTTAAEVTYSGFWNNTAPTSTLFTLGNDTEVNTGSGTYIAYCFAEVKGYSKMGSYVGNGSTNGTFVYTGFKPAFVLWKVSSTTEGWYLVDNKRDTYNASGNYILPNTSATESGANSILDLLSNGFKFRDSGGAWWNGSGSTYIYMAFAENPFVSSKGIPCTAR